jgi:hypothetical protein
MAARKPIPEFLRNFQPGRQMEILVYSFRHITYHINIGEKVREIRRRIELETARNSEHSDGQKLRLIHGLWRKATIPRHRYSRWLYAE